MSKFFGIFNKLGPRNAKPIENSADSLPSGSFFITPNIIIIPFPSADLAPKLLQCLNKKLHNMYMIWNLSEYPHPTNLLSLQTIDFIFIGYPNPPLSVMYSIFHSMKSWLLNPDNIAVVHCQSTKGRSYMFLSSFLTWCLKYPDVLTAFHQICEISHEKVKLLPSQYRYMKYVESLLNSPKPISKKITIKKIILDGIPQIENNSFAVRPYLQIFKLNDMIYCSSSKKNPPTSYYDSDISICFDVNLEIEGDVLIRCRHFGSDNQPITIFRVMFHTTFVNDFVLRFQKNDIDGAFNDDRFAENFNLDVFLEALETVHGSELEKNFCRFEEKASNESEKKLVAEELENPIPKDGESDEELDDYFKNLESK